MAKGARGGKRGTLGRGVSGTNIDEFIKKDPLKKWRDEFGRFNENAMNYELNHSSYEKLEKIIAKNEPNANALREYIMQSGDRRVEVLSRFNDYETLVSGANGAIDFKRQVEKEDKERAEYIKRRYGV